MLSVWASGAGSSERRSLLWRKHDRYSPLCALHATCIFFGYQVLILFWTHLPCFFSILYVCMPGLFCSAAFWLVRIAYCGRLGQGAEKNRAIKRFRNRAISNRDFILISINRTALLFTLPKTAQCIKKHILTSSAGEVESRMIYVNINAFRKISWGWRWGCWVIWVVNDNCYVHYCIQQQNT